MSRRAAGAVTVRFDAPVGRVFAYLAAPGNRPAWQSSLRAVDPAEPGAPRVGQRWHDVTVPGLRPAMEITELVTDRRWVERGRWRGVEAELVLEFTPISPGTATRDAVQTDVTARLRLAGRGPWRLPALAARVLARPAVAADLRRASRLV